MNEFIKGYQGDLGLKPDGKRGPVTDAALLNAADQGWLTIAKPVFINVPVDLTPSKDPQLARVNPILKDVLEEALIRSAVPFDIIEGERTVARQKELVARGASKTMNSLHLIQRSGFAHAADAWPMDPKTGDRLPAGTAAREAALWARLRVFAAIVKAVAKERGVLIEWGGDWGWDAPHFQLNRAAYA